MKFNRFNRFFFFNFIVSSWPSIIFNTNIPIHWWFSTWQAFTFWWRFSPFSSTICLSTRCRSRGASISVSITNWIRSFGIGLTTIFFFLPVLVHLCRKKNHEKIFNLQWRNYTIGRCVLRFATPKNVRVKDYIVFSV